MLRPRLKLCGSTFPDSRVPPVGVDPLAQNSAGETRRGAEGVEVAAETTAHAPIINRPGEKDEPASRIFGPHDARRMQRAVFFVVESDTGRQTGRGFDGERGAERCAIANGTIGDETAVRVEQAAIAQPGRAASRKTSIRGWRNVRTRLVHRPPRKFRTSA